MIDRRWFQRGGVALFAAALAWFLMMAIFPGIFTFNKGPGIEFGIGIAAAWFGMPSGKDDIWPVDGSETDWPGHGSASDISFDDLDND